MPFINERYRTQTDRAQTTIGGSGFGGLIAMHVARRHADRFGRVVALSPYLRLEGQSVAQGWKDQLDAFKSIRLYLEMASLSVHYPGEKPLDDAHEFVSLLESAGLQRGAAFEYEELDGVEQNEPAWAQRFDYVLLRLYGR